MMQKSWPLNKYCPNSGKPVQLDSLVDYQGKTFGFCNPGCRDEFAKDLEADTTAKRYFDVLLKEMG